MQFSNMTGVIYDAVTNDWAVVLEAAGGVIGYATTASEAASMLNDEVARFERFHSSQAASLAAMMPASVEAPAIAPQAATAPLSCAPVALPVASESRPRCPHYRAIRRAFAIAREKGLDVRADEAMRAAFGRCLGRTVETRECMNGGEWQAVGDAMKRGLAW
jgi:hypothetical protein